MTDLPELSRLVRVETIGLPPRLIEIDADPAEREMLAKRFGLVALDRLRARVEVSADAGGPRASGRIDAAVVQACVASGIELPSVVAEDFALRFVPALDAEGDEIELGEDDLDTLPFDNGAIDIGEAVAQTLALALDPWPRAPDADAVLSAAGVIGEDDTGPFAALRTLRKPPVH